MVGIDWGRAVLAFLGGLIVVLVGGAILGRSPEETLPFGVVLAIGFAAGIAITSGMDVGTGDGD